MLNFILFIYYILNFKFSTLYEWNYTYKNILLNVANVTKDYKNLYKNKQVCILIEVFDNKKKVNLYK